METINEWKNLTFESLNTIGGGIASTLPNILGAIVILIVGWLITKIVTLILKKSDPFTSGIKYFFLLAGGIYFPVSLLPDWLLFIGKLFPIIDSVDLVREIFYDASLDIDKFLYISIHALILFPISVFSEPSSSKSCVVILT